MLYAVIPFERPVLADNVSWHAPMREVDTPEPAGAPSEDALRFHRHWQLGHIGVDTMLVGTGAVLVGLVGLIPTTLGCAIVGGFSECGEIWVPVVIIGAGAVAVNVGEVLMFVGGIEAAYDGERLGLDTSPTIGWVGVALAGGGVVLNALATGGVITDPSGASGASTASGILALGGLILGAVQLGQDGHAGRDADLVMLPTLGRAPGLEVAGAF